MQVKCHCHVFINSNRTWERLWRSRNCTFGSCKICELLIFWSRSNSMNVWRPCWQRLLLQVWVVCVSFSNHGIENQFLPGSDCSGSWQSQIYTCAQDCSDYLRLDICCGNAIRRADACMYANSWDEKPQLNILIEHPRALEAFHLSHMQANHEQIFPWIPATTPAVGTSSWLQAATVTKHFGTW